MSALNAAANTGVIPFLNGTGIVSQLVLSVILSTLLYIGVFCVEAVYMSWMQVTGTKVPINAYTVTSDKQRTYVTNPNVRNAVYLPPSDNERTGAEYSYSCFLMIKDSTFGTEVGMRHIFHRGYVGLYPLLNPGVFLLSNTNTLRVYQNSSKKWNNYTDIPNIPVNKWIHLVVMARKNGVEVYINGNLSSKITLVKDTLYQNYQDIHCFVNTVDLNLTNGIVASVPADDPYRVLKGAPNVLMSRFTYFNYALSYTEIRDLMREGPNSQMEATNEQLPPYFLDNWWTGQQYLM